MLIFNWLYLNLRKNIVKILAKIPFLILLKEINYKKVLKKSNRSPNWGKSLSIFFFMNTKKRAEAPLK